MWHRAAHVRAHVRPGLPIVRGDEDVPLIAARVRRPLARVVRLPEGTAGEMSGLAPVHGEELGNLLRWRRPVPEQLPAGAARGSPDTGRAHPVHLARRTPPTPHPGR